MGLLFYPLLLTFRSGFMVLIQWLGSSTDTLKLDLESVYYFFSTFAQTIGALVGLTIAGFALVFNILDGLEKRDESFSEINEQLKKKYHVEVTILMITSGLAIMLDLIDLPLNHVKFTLKADLYVLTALINTLVLALVVWFVIDMINPNKDKRMAQKLLNRQTGKPALSDVVVSSGDFIDAFIQIERYLRDFIQRSGIEKEIFMYKGTSRTNFLSFRDIVAGLYRSGRIGADLYAELIEINRYRNLVVHGHVESVDSAMLVRLRQASDDLRQLLR